MTTSSPPFAMGRKEFVALIAMMTASVAFAIDAMLPALPQIGRELSPEMPEQAPLILSAFLLGMGLGTFVAGPISDALGRKRVILIGAALYCSGAAAAWMSDSITPMLVARLIQGIGAAGPRIVAMAVIRDRFAGRQMAQVVSIVMMIFVLVPAFAPLIGATIIALAGWRAIFAAFIVFALVYVVWMLIRLPETLPPKNRRPMRIGLMALAIREIFGNRMVSMSILVQTLTMSMLFLTLMLVQPNYDLTYGRADEFPLWFCGIALIAGMASLLNAMLVMRFGMIRLIRLTLWAQVLISAIFVFFDLGVGPNGFYFFVLWQTCMFFQAGLTIGNLNALAMEPMGHVAGMAASVIGAVSTVGAALTAATITALAGTGVETLFLSALVLAALGSLSMIKVARTQTV